MLTYHNEPALKAARIANAKRHCALDLLVAGTYDDGEGHGCSVGCDAIDIGYDGDDPHSAVAEKWGTPVWLEHLRDVIFEGLAKDQRAEWHLRMAEAIPVGADLTLCFHRFFAWLLGPESPSAIGNSHTTVASAIALVRDYHLSIIDGTLARSAADSAAYSARSAADSAADSAARSAAYSAMSHKLLELLAVEQAGV